MFSIVRSAVLSPRIGFISQRFIGSNPCCSHSSSLSQRRRLNYSTLPPPPTGALYDVNYVNELDTERINTPNAFSDSIVESINKKISGKQHGRLFAVVHLDGHQFKITQGDIIVLRGNQPFDIGDEICLEKVLLVGSPDFTLIGRPLLPRTQVKVVATVIEQTWSHTTTYFFRVPRKQIAHPRFLREPQNMLRINKIEILEGVE